MKIDFKVGDKVLWKNLVDKQQTGTILKIYKTTFGSKIKDIAL